MTPNTEEEVNQGSKDDIEIPGSLTGPFTRTLGAVNALLSPLWAFGIYVILRGGPIPRLTSVTVVLGTAALVAGLAWFLVASTISVSVKASEDGVSVVLRTIRPLRRCRVFVRWPEFSEDVVFSSFDGTVALTKAGPPKIFIGLTVAQAKAVLSHPHCTIRNIPPALVRRLTGT